MKAVSKSRIRWMCAGFIFFAALLVVRLYVLQILEHQAFEDKANRQYTNPAAQVFDRGSIFFETRDGTKVSAATLKEGYILAINPTVISDPEKTYDALNAVVPLDKDTFMTDVAKKDASYIQIADQLTEDQEGKIGAYNLAGVSMFEERWRYYPAGPLASQVIGFLGYGSDGTFGPQYGLEKQYDSVLSRNTENVYTNFFAQIFSNFNKGVTYSALGQGDIVTTIEPNVQSVLEKEIAETNQKYNSQFSGGIIINPQTGAIYAMANYPTFDPNFFRVVTDPSVFTNKLVQDTYEMGSIIKPLTMAAGIDAGVVTPTSTYDDMGYLKLNGSTIWNYDLTGRGPGTTMQDVLNQSLNTGAATVALKLGNALFTNYMYKFGLAEPTGIDLPSEAADQVSNLSVNRDLEHATAAFGQGIALTPIATVRALSALANGGYLVSPHVVQEIDYTSGLVNHVDPGPGPRVISTTTSATLIKMLESVYSYDLTDDGLPQSTTAGYLIGTKTGTAQIANPNGGGYISDQYLHSFFGFFPANNPQFLVFLYTFEPQGQEFASRTLTQPFLDITKFILNYYDIPPSQ